DRSRFWELCNPAGLTTPALPVRVLRRQELPPSRWRRWSRFSLQIAASLGRRFSAFVGKPEFLAIRLLVLDAGNLERRLVTRAVAVNDQLLANLQRILGDAVADQAVGRPAFNAPLRDHAVIALDVEPDPRVRVDQFNLR